MKIRFLLAILIIVALAACKIGGSETTTTSSEACTDVNGACGENSDCCSYGCIAGVCVQNPVLGGACRTTNDCIYGRLCKSRACTTEVPGMCRDNADVCSSRYQCCSGNCLSSSCTVNRPPVADAGPDVPNVPYTKVYTLANNTAPDPDGDPLIYGWSFVSWPGSTVPTLNSSTARNPSFTPPTKGTYVLRLVVTDGPPDAPNRLSSQDEVTLTVVNNAPVASLTADPSTCGLVAGTASRNVDCLIRSTVSDPDNDALVCSWRLVAPGETTSTEKVAAAPCTSTSPPTWTFKPLREGPYTIELVVIDHDNQSGLPVNTTVAHLDLTSINDAPVAGVKPIVGNEPSTIYANLDATGSATITVDGSPPYSSDKNGDSLTYFWSVPSSPSPITLADQTAQIQTFTVGPGANTGDYQLQLIVTDAPWNDPLYPDANRPGDPSTPLLVTVKVGPYVKPLAGSHDLIDADMAKGVTPNRIVLLGKDPLDNNPKLWVYDVDSGQEGAPIPVQDPVGGGYSNTPSSVGITSTGATAVVGDAINVWTVSLSTPYTVTKFDPGLTCSSCANVFPVGDVAVVGNRHAFFFRSNSTTTSFVKLDLSNNGFTASPYGGRYGASSDGAVKYLFVANASSSRIDRYFIQSNQSLGWDTSVSTACTSGDLFANELGTYVFDACGNAYTNGTWLTLHPTLKLAPSPARLDSLADGPTVTLGTNAQQVNRYTSTLVSEPSGPDYLPIWADVNGGKHQTYGMHAFLAPNGKRIVFLRTNETTNRYGVFTFGP